eukprot:PLAT6433.20.p1 GENE.PLAT6433.20~~PLAT6433.20.p1  ORF type:complete len:1000 (+),score=414.27 PLAT6433.20:13-3012(+)
MLHGQCCLARARVWVRAVFADDCCVLACCRNASIIVASDAQVVSLVRSEYQRILKSILAEIQFRPNLLSGALGKARARSRWRLAAQAVRPAMRLYCWPLNDDGAVDLLVTLLKQVKVVRSIPMEARKAVCAHLTHIVIPEDRAVYHRTDPTAYFYIIVKGSVSLCTSFSYKEEDVVMTLGPGQWFGELELLQQLPTRLFSATAASGTALVRLADRHFRRLWPDRAVYASKLASIARLSLFGPLDAEKRSLLYYIVQTRTYPRNAVIAREGQASEHIYVIKAGQCKALMSMHIGPPGRRKRLKVEVAQLGVNALFGGGDVMLDTVIAVPPRVDLLFFSKERARALLSKRMWRNLQEVLQMKNEWKRTRADFLHSLVRTVEDKELSPRTSYAQAAALLTSSASHMPRISMTHLMHQRNAHELAEEEEDVILTDMRSASTTARSDAAALAAAEAAGHMLAAEASRHVYSYDRPLSPGASSVMRPLSAHSSASLAAAAAAASRRSRSPPPLLPSTARSRTSSRPTSSYSLRPMSRDGRGSRALSPSSSRPGSARPGSAASSLRPSSSYGRLSKAVASLRSPSSAGGSSSSGSKRRRRRQQQQQRALSSPSSPSASASHFSSSMLWDGGGSEGGGEGDAFDDDDSRSVYTPSPSKRPLSAHTAVGSGSIDVPPLMLERTKTLHMVRAVTAPDQKAVRRRLKIAGEAARKGRSVLESPFGHGLRDRTMLGKASYGRGAMLSSPTRNVSDAVLRSEPRDKRLAAGAAAVAAGAAAAGAAGKSGRRAAAGRRPHTSASVRRSASAPSLSGESGMLMGSFTSKGGISRRMKREMERAREAEAERALDRRLRMQSRVLLPAAEEFDIDAEHSRMYHRFVSRLKAKARGNSTVLPARPGRLHQRRQRHAHSRAIAGMGALGRSITPAMRSSPSLASPSSLRSGKAGRRRRPASSGAGGRLRRGRPKRVAPAAATAASAAVVSPSSAASSTASAVARRGRARRVDIAMPVT